MMNSINQVTTNAVNNGVVGARGGARGVEGYQQIPKRPQISDKLREAWGLFRAISNSQRRKNTRSQLTRSRKSSSFKGDNMEEMSSKSICSHCQIDIPFQCIENVMYNGRIKAIRWKCPSCGTLSLIPMLPLTSEDSLGGS